MGKIQSSNRALQNLTSASFVNLSSGDRIVKNAPGSLLKVVLNTNGGAVTVRDGGEVIAEIASDAPEQVFDYGVWCDVNINVIISGTVDITVVFD